MTRTVLLLGTNLGDMQNNLAKATKLLSERVGQIEQESSVYVTPPWGFESDQEFYNQVIIVSTLLSPQMLLSRVLKIETELGRNRGEGTHVGYQDRLMDIDILFYERLIVKEANLIIPHPHLHKRRFTLAPLAEVIPGYVHPVLLSSMKDLLEACEDKSMLHILKSSSVL